MLGKNGVDVSRETMLGKNGTDVSRETKWTWLRYINSKLFYYMIQVPSKKEKGGCLRLRKSGYNEKSEVK